MKVTELLKDLGEQLQVGANVKNVYGEPVSAADRTVIPVAQVRYAFGGGGGGSEDSENPDRGGGGGGGARASAKPIGVLEISAQGTRFVPIEDWTKTLGLLALGLVIGFWIGKTRHS